jgi:hypothetical protein
MGMSKDAAVSVGGSDGTRGGLPSGAASNFESEMSKSLAFAIAVAAAGTSIFSTSLPWLSPYRIFFTAIRSASGTYVSSTRSTL